MINLKILKDYYKNSPRRIGWTWAGVHLFFVFVASILFHLPVWSVSFLRFVAAIVFLFPFWPLAMIISTPPYYVEIMMFLLTPVYYILYIFVLLKAKDTSSKFFVIIQRVFLVWFLISLVFSFFALFDLMSSKIPL